MNLAIKLRELRKEKGFTQTDLAKLTGLATSCISMIEIGQREASAHTIFQLAKALNVSSDYLLGLEDDFGNVVISNGVSPSLEPGEEELIKNFRQLNMYQRDAISLQAKILAEDNLKVIKK